MADIRVGRVWLQKKKICIKIIIINQIGRRKDYGSGAEKNKSD